MKLTKLLKTIAISVCLAASFAIAGLSLTGCGGETPDSQKPDRTEEIKQATSAAVDFLMTARNGWNYSYVSEYSDGSVYKYYTDNNRIKVEYNGTFYALNADRIYKIVQADDMTWHKTNDSTDVIEPYTKINNHIDSINNTSNASLWSDYDSKTKMLTATYLDGSATIKLDAGELTITLITDKGTTKHTIKDVGSTTVTLPEDIIDDTLN
ncbi:MAG: hypothetical protein K2I75_00575 [Clostridiales bacterium]|nr:hypothetical protein [Clostridiales bacterium]